MLLRSEDVLFEEALFYELLQVPPKGPAVNGLMPLTFVVGAVPSDQGSDGLYWSDLGRLTHD